MSSGGWCTIESDPGVFAELISRIGVSGVDVEELYDLDVASLQALGKIYGLIFLFKWEGKSMDDKGEPQFLQDTSSMFFAHQVIQDACATQAILSILMNIQDEDVKLGGTLGDFAAFTREFDPSLKGMAIGEHELIREVHNSFRRPDAVYVDEAERDPEGGEDPFHFVSILPVNGRLLELDGLKEAPIILSESSNDWVSTALEHIRKRIERMQSGGSGEIRFNLMAVIQDRSIAIQREVSALDADSEWKRPELEAMLADDVHRKELRARENTLKKHNFVPLVMAILDLMAKNKPDLIKAAF